jgi:hypothetical protein
MTESATSDDLVLVPESILSLDEIDCAGIKDIHEIVDWHVRHAGETTVHTIRLGGDSRFCITYSADRKIAEYEAHSVKFERLGDEIFVSRT